MDRKKMIYKFQKIFPYSGHIGKGLAVVPANVIGQYYNKIHKYGSCMWRIFLLLRLVYFRRVGLLHFGRPQDSRLKLHPHSQATIV